jgi:hypothetical protein
MKDATATMGSVLPDEVGGRDAVHVAVIACIANDAEELLAGQDVGVLPVKSSTGEYIAATARIAPSLIGIVDPFLKTKVSPRQRFWLFLYPRTITSLKHQWTHPAFEEMATAYAPPSQRMISEQWLRNFAESNDCPYYEKMLAIAVDFLDGDDPGDGEYLLSRGSGAHCEIPPEFWLHVENVTGRKVSGARPTHFSCSC